MRLQSCLFLVVHAACSPTTGKVSVEADDDSPSNFEGTDDEGFVEDQEGEGADSEAEADDDTEEGLDGDGVEGWDRVPGWSAVTSGMPFGFEQDVWLFTQDIAGEFGPGKDDHGADVPEPSPACVMEMGGWEPICISYTGVAWGSESGFDPEEECLDYEIEEGGEWSYREDGCNDDDAKAMCLLAEGTDYSLKVLYYSPMPLSTAQESCEADGGSFYALGTEEGEEDEREFALGTRWVGFVVMDHSVGVASFERFTASGENCKANSQMVAIEEVRTCDQCQFSKRFQLGEFGLEVDEGGCPRRYLEDLVGEVVSFGQGQVILGEDGGTVFYTLMQHNPADG